MKNFSKEIYKKNLQNFQKTNYKNFTSDHNMQWYENKIGKNFREFQIKERAYHNILWYAD